MDTNTLIVAACLILEAGGEGERGMELVREVICTRASERRMNEARVCLQRLQFSCFNGIDWHTAVEKAAKHPRWNLAVKLAGSKPLTDHTKRANHYCTVNISPSWAKGRTPVLVHRNHKFYRIK